MMLGEAAWISTQYFTAEVSRRNSLSQLTQDHGVQLPDRCTYKKGNGPEEYVSGLSLGHLSTWLPGKVATGSGLLLRLNVLGGHRLSALHVEKQLLALRGVFLMDTHA